MSNALNNLLSKVTKGVSALFDKGKEVVAGQAPHLSYQRLTSKRVRVKHADLARVASERRRFRNALYAAVRRNTRGLPAGMSPFVARRARSIEAQAMHGHLEDSAVGELRMAQADRTLQTLSENTNARRRIDRPSKFARRTGVPDQPFPKAADGVHVELPLRLRVKSCRPSVMMAALQERRATFGAR